MTTPEIEELKQLIEEKYGKALNTTTDFEEFSLFLQQTTGRNVSASTLKRMWGYVSDDHKPRTATLDTLSAFVGHRDYKTFKDWLKTSTRFNSSFFDARQLTSARLSAGEEIRIGWSPNRLVTLRYLGDSTFEVTASANSKLRPGDTFVAGCFIMGQPLYLPYLVRDGARTPPFVAGRNGGLTVIEALNFEL